jgi:hypothetical protein
MSRRKRKGLGLKIVVWTILIIALGPSLVNLPRAWVACKLLQKVPETVSTSDDAATRDAIQKIPDYYRPESKTYLTLPEWYIVYSTDEYAAFVADHSSSDFPYFNAVGQYWQSYVDVCGVIKGRYPLNGDSQFTDGFIGISFTAEYMLKGTYELTLGHISSWVSSDKPTDEEIYAAQVAKEYGTFLHTTPWYFFPFGEKLKGLWSDVSLSGPDPIRKWERRFELTLEYGGKALYGGLTNLGAKAAYGGADVEKIYAVTTGMTDDMLSKDLEITQKIDDQKQLIRITRFEYFSNTVPGLMERGVQFIEIAGNHEILFTLIGPQDADYKFEHGQYLFDLPILTQPKLTRVAVKVSVADIGAFLQELKNHSNVKFEHMYDY